MLEMILKVFLILGSINTVISQTLDLEANLQVTEDNKNVGAIISKYCTNDTECPPWTECNGNQCECLNQTKGTVSMTCNPQTLQLSVRRCHCITYDKETRDMTSGMCIENCVFKDDVKLFLPLPLNVSQLNRFMCEERWNRTGRLCGQCLPGHSPLAYSYDMRCVKCPQGNRNIWKYILVAFGPLTIFYIVVLLLKINATSSHLHGYVIFAQMLSLPHFYRIADTYSQVGHSESKIPLKIVAAFFGIWNLDFFRGLYPEICLDVSTLTVLALDYAVAIYPLLLTVLSYILIELHARNFRPVVVCWKPFRYLFLLMRKNWDSKTTVIDAFATFFLLSFTKIAWVSSDIFIASRVHYMKAKTSFLVSYYDSTLEYFGSQHSPYVITAFIFCLTLSIFPVVMCIIYPFNWFQKVLNCTKLHTHFLRALMESFQGYYKDGTEPGTRDYRWFAAIPLIGRFSLLIAYIAKLEQTLVSLTIIIILAIMLATVTIQPYKKRFKNYLKMDIFFWTMLAFFFNTQDCYNYAAFKIPDNIVFSEALSFFSIAIPLLYIIVVAMYWILSRVRKIKIILSRFKAWRRDYVDLESEGHDNLPDRLINPGQYQGASPQQISGQKLVEFNSISISY